MKPPCNDCIEVDGKLLCTMNCGPAAPVKDDPLGIEFARKVAGGHAKLTHDLIRTATEKHIADTFNNAPSRDDLNYEAEYAKQVMLHAVTQFELKEAKTTIEQLKSYQANYEHATKIDRAEKDADMEKLEALLSDANAERRVLREALKAFEEELPSCQPLPDKDQK